MHIPLIDKFPVEALVIQKRGHGISSVKDKARFMGKDADTYYEFKKLGMKTLPCSYDQMIIQSGGKPLTIFYEFERNMVIPLDLNDLGRNKQKTKIKVPKMVKIPKLDKEGNPKLDKDGKNVMEETQEKDDNGSLVTTTKEVEFEVAEMLKIIDPGVAFWGQQRRRKAEERHKEESWWDKNQMFIMHAMTWILMIVLTYIFMGAIADTSFSVIDVMMQYVDKGGIPPG